jgi:hypothetical protein
MNATQIMLNALVLVSCRAFVVKSFSKCIYSLIQLFQEWFLVSWIFSSFFLELKPNSESFKRLFS